MIAELYPEAIESYKKVLRIQPDNDDAKHNLELALSKLPEQDQGEEPEENDQEGPQEQEQQQQQDQQDQQDEQNEQDQQQQDNEEQQDEQQEQQQNDEQQDQQQAQEQPQPQQRPQTEPITRGAGEAVTGNVRATDTSGAVAADPRVTRTSHERMVSTNVRHASFIRRALAGIALAMALMAAAVPAVHAQQQDIEVTAEVDKTELAVGEEFTLWVKIDGALNPRQPAIPNYDGIRRLGPPSRRWIRVGDGHHCISRMSIRFVATKVGKVTI